MSGEKQPLVIKSMLDTSYSGSSSSSSMEKSLHKPKAGSSVDTSSIVISDNDQLKGSGDAILTQKWEIVIAYPNVPAHTSLDADEMKKQEKRDSLVKELRDVGLYVGQRESSNSEVVFLLVGASQERLEEQAEFEGVELKLKVFLLFSFLFPFSLSPLLLFLGIFLLFFVICYLFSSF